MIILDTNGDELELTKSKLSEIVPEFSNVTYSYVLLKELKGFLTEGTSSVKLYPLNPSLNRVTKRVTKKDISWITVGAYRSRLGLADIGCRTFDRATTNKIIKAIKAAIKPKKGTKKKKK